MTRRLKDPVLEKYLAGAMDDAARAAVDSTLAESPEDAQRLKELQADSEAFLLQHPPAAFAAKAVPDHVPFWRRPPLFGPLLAAVVAVVLLVVVLPRRHDDDTTVKGAVALVIHRKTPTGSETLGPDAVLHPGDELRFEVRAGAPGTVAVYGRDAQGVVRYAPRSGGSAPTSDAPLADAIALDEAKGPETFYAVWAPQPFDVEAVRAALAQGRDVDEVVPGALMAERVVDKR